MLTNFNQQLYARRRRANTQGLFLSMCSMALGLTVLFAAEVSAEAWGPPVAMHLPALTVTVGDMVAALERVAQRGDDGVLRLLRERHGREGRSVSTEGSRRRQFRRRRDRRRHR